jgi:hypothetical protein
MALTWKFIINKRVNGVRYVRIICPRFLEPLVRLYLDVYDVVIMYQRTILDRPESGIVG